MTKLWRNNLDEFCKRVYGVANWQPRSKSSVANLFVYESSAGGARWYREIRPSQNPFCVLRTDDVAAAHAAYLRSRVRQVVVQEPEFPLLQEFWNTEVLKHMLNQRPRDRSGRFLRPKPKLNLLRGYTRGKLFDPQTFLSDDFPLSVQYVNPRELYNFLAGPVLFDGLPSFDAEHLFLCEYSGSLEGCPAGLPVLDPALVEESYQVENTFTEGDWTITMHRRRADAHEAMLRMDLREDDDAHQTERAAQLLSGAVVRVNQAEEAEQRRLAGKDEVALLEDTGRMRSLPSSEDEYSIFDRSEDEFLPRLGRKSRRRRA